MPVIAAYFGVSLTSVLVYADSDKFTFVTFPYFYSEDLFGNHVDEATFNTSILEMVLKSLNDPLSKEDKFPAKISSYDILTAGYLSVPKLSVAAKYSTVVPEMLRATESCNAIFVNLWGVSSRGGTRVRQLNAADFMPAEASLYGHSLDFVSNLSLYSQMAPVEMSTRAHIDQNLVKICPDLELTPVSDIPAVFTGDRFSQFVKNPELDYLLTLGLLRTLGLFELAFDDKNALILIHLLNTYLNDSVLNFMDFTTPIGTLLNTLGFTECLIEDQVGARQMFTVEKDVVYMNPLSPGTSAKLTFKNHTHAHQESHIEGGNLGLIVDTREVKGSLAGDIRLFNDSIKIIDEALHGL
jgi:hypothetical protein